MSIRVQNELFKTLDHDLFQGSTKLKKIYSGDTMVYPSVTEKKINNKYRRFIITRTIDFRWLFTYHTGNDIFIYGWGEFYTIEGSLEEVFDILIYTDDVKIIEEPLNGDINNRCSPFTKYDRFYTSPFSSTAYSKLSDLGALKSNSNSHFSFGYVESIGGTQYKIKIKPNVPFTIVYTPTNINYTIQPYNTEVTVHPMDPLSYSISDYKLCYDSFNSALKRTDWLDWQERSRKELMKLYGEEVVKDEEKYVNFLFKTNPEIKGVWENYWDTERLDVTGGIGNVMLKLSLHALQFASIDAYYDQDRDSLIGKYNTGTFPSLFDYLLLLELKETDQESPYTFNFYNVYNGTFNSRFDLNKIRLASRTAIGNCIGFTGEQTLVDPGEDFCYMNLPYANYDGEQVPQYMVIPYYYAADAYHHGSKPDNYVIRNVFKDFFDTGSRVIKSDLTIKEVQPKKI